MRALRCVLLPAQLRPQSCVPAFLVPPQRRVPVSVALPWLRCVSGLVIPPLYVRFHHRWRGAAAEVRPRVDAMRSSGCAASARAAVPPIRCVSTPVSPRRWAPSRRRCLRRYPAASVTVVASAAAGVGAAMIPVPLQRVVPVSAPPLCVVS